MPSVTDRPTVFTRLGRFVVRHRVVILAGYILAVLACVIAGRAVFGSLQTGGFSDPASDSAQVAQLLTDDFGTQEPVAVLAAESAYPIDDPRTVSAVQDLLVRVEAVPGVASVTSYWTAGSPAELRGSDGRTGEIVVYATPDVDERELARTLVSDFDGQQADLRVYVFGSPVVGNAFNETITSDLARAESVAVPITIILLIFVFGSVVSAGLPFLVAAGSIGGSLLVMWLISLTTDVSVFALNLVTGMGLALGIDYALLAINRFREELRAGRTTDDAVITTVATAGRTVVVSGVTVAVTLASLLFCPQFFLKSFAYAGISVSLLAVIGTVSALPALLSLLGSRVNRLRVRRGDLAPADDGAWARIARGVMRRPWPILVACVAVLLILAAPALGAVYGQVDDRALPRDNPAAIAGQVLRDRFPGAESSPYDVVLLQAQDSTAVDAYAEELSLIPHALRVITPTSVIVGGRVVAPNPSPATWRAGADVRLAVIGNVPPIDPQGGALVAAIRAVPPPAEQALVGGLAATFADATDGILSRVWMIALWIAVTTLLVLFLYTGSILLPVKALLMNLLSLSATLGVLVSVFQDNHLTWLTGDYTPTGTIDISTLALIAVVAFALSMDYELFLLSRIKEEHDAGRSTADAVAFGLQRTGRIITAAALLIAIVFASFVTTGTTNIKQLGFGVTVAILLDATLVRGLLVPAFMRVAGRANWWAPAPLRRLHARLGLSDH